MKERIKWPAGNRLDLCIPLRKITVTDGGTQFGEYIPSQAAVVMVYLVGNYASYEFTPRIEDNKLYISDNGELKPGVYAIDVRIQEPERKLRSFRCGELEIVRETKQLALGDFVLDNNITLDADAFIFGEGPSAYEVAVRDGYTGTKAEWMESMRGKEGRGIADIVALPTGAFRILLTDGSAYVTPILKGEQGVSISDISVTGITTMEVLCTVTMSDGTTHQLNLPRGEQGAKGDKGDDGQDGRGIQSIVLNADYTLTFNYTDGTSYTTPQSLRGEKGENGKDGQDGRGISSMAIDDDNHLTVSYTDGTTYTTPQSLQGERGVSITDFEQVGESATMCFFNIYFSNGNISQIGLPKGEQGDRGETGPQGRQGDTVVLGEVGEYKLYNVAGAATDGAMTQDATTKAIAAATGWYECGTAAGTAAKVATGDNEALYTLQKGGSIKVKMTNANAAASGVTLKIGSAAATPLYYNNEPVSASNTWEAGEVISVYFDGTYYQASNSQGGSNKKIDAYLYGDLRDLKVGQTYDTGSAVKTTDKQLRRLIKEITPLSLSETLVNGSLKTSGNVTYRATSAIDTYNPSTTYTEGEYALGSMTVYTLTITADSITAGNITVNGTEVAIEAADNATTIAVKIASALIIDGWTTSVADNVVTVRCNTIGNNTTTITIDPDTENTGITIEESSIAGTNVIRKYDGETWANATVAGMVEDSVLVVVDEAWLIANATIQNTITRDINWYTSLDNKDGDFTWEVGNITNRRIVTYHSNRYTIFNKNSLGNDVDSFTIYNGGISGKTFGLYYYNGSEYISIGNLKIGNNVINAIGRQQFLILVWDKPTATQTANCSLRVFTEIKIKDVVEKHEERIADLEDNLSVEDIHYSSELYKNSDGDFAWKTGNPSNPQYASTANKYFIVDVGRKINKLRVYKTTSSLYMYTCAVVGNSYINILGGRTSVNTTIDLSNYNYTKIYCLLYKRSGTPTTQEALAETIELTFDFALDGELASLETRISTLESSAGALKFTNPVIKIDYPDPDIWNGEDGYWYAYATGNLTTKSMWRSANLVNWENTGETPFTQAAIERWTALGKGTFWAPEIVKVGDHWNMYISSTANPLYVFTSKQPTSGFNFVRDIMHSGISGDNENIDACVRYDREGRLWMFWSASKGICRIRLSDDGLSIAEGAVLEHVAGLPHAQDTSDRAHTFEAPYLYRRRGYWYLIVSAGLYNNSTYCLRVGRCATLDGTFVDKEGNLMTEGNGSLLLTGSGNFYGPGHNGRIITDKDNKTWMLFHSHWTGASSSSARHMCISEVLWDEDGWPYFVNNTLTASGIGPRM